MSDKNLDRPIMQLQPDDWTSEFSCMMCDGKADLLPIVFDSGPETYQCEGCGQRYWPPKS